jgi:putative ATP-binding cassette transporter
MGSASSYRYFIRDIWRLTKSYWKSEEKISAFALLAGIIGLTIAIVVMLVLLNQWNAAFYNALQNYDTEVILHELFHFSWLAALYIIFSVYSFYLQQVLGIRWRRWLTGQYLDRWLQHKTYYRLQMFGAATDNPDQRISEDIRMFVEKTIEFAIGLIKALCILCAFIFILYSISGTLQFSLLGQDWEIPGYLVWIALAYAIVGTWLTHVVGYKLVRLNFIQQRYEADFRFSMMRMRESAESVAFYSGEKQERSVFQQRFMTLLNNFWKIIQKKKQLIWLNSGYSQIAIIFPFVVVMPRYLSKEISLGGLMQIANAFGKVQESLSYFVDMYTTLAEWKAVVDRLTGFTHHMETAQEDTAAIVPAQRSIDEKLLTEHLNVLLPKGNPILEDISLCLHAHENVLIRGVSGSGKSTFLRAIAGIWPYVTGSIAMPQKKNTLFVPQKPYLPLGTLQQALLYPGQENRSQEELESLLDLCYIGYLKDQLLVEADWSHVLSIGEQQRLAFVRIFLQEPQWLFLDEATSALDEATEAYLYRMLQERLPGTTVVSVGHRSTLTAFHTLALNLHKDTHSITVESLLPNHGVITAEP